MPREINPSINVSLQRLIKYVMTINRLDFYSNCFKIEMCMNVQIDIF